MIVKELIELLQQHNPNLRVVVDGYEGGLEDIFKNSLSTCDIGLDVNHESYYGKHEMVGSYMYEQLREPVVHEHALIISRDGHAEETK